MMDEDVKIQVPVGILESWQEIANILAQLVGVRAALIMRNVDEYIEVFVSSKSKENPYHTGDKKRLWGSGLYCETVIRSRDKLLVPNALTDEHWKNNPDVRLGMISYLGFPIRLPNRRTFGTLCVLDNQANEYSETTENLMLKFRSLIESHLEIVYVNQVLGDKNKQLVDYLTELQAFRGLVHICANCKSIRDEGGSWIPIEHYLIHHPEADFSHGICPQCMDKLYPGLIGTRKGQPVVEKDGQQR